MLKDIPALSDFVTFTLTATGYRRTCCLRYDLCETTKFESTLADSVSSLTRRLHAIESVVRRIEIARNISAAETKPGCGCAAGFWAYLWKSINNMLHVYERNLPKTGQNPETIKVFRGIVAADTTELAKAFLF